MAGSINRVVLLGTVGRHGVTLRYAPSGAPCASFWLVLTEETQEGKYFSTLVPCELWGRKAEQLSTELQPGMLCVFEGKVSRKRKGETWEFVVSGFDVSPITPAPVEV